MLLFIVNQAGALDTSLGFQNISCYCLSGNDDSLKSKIVISKHLMLLFICISASVGITYNVFQNISCYCLSNAMSDADYEQLYFKTSHVIVYHIHIIRNILLSVFQNISCYCLSLAFPRFLVSPLPFSPLYFLYFSIFYQPTPLSWTALLIIP